MQRLDTGEQLAAQHRPEGLWIHGRAGARGDVLGSRIGLLRRDTALLDGERRAVAGRVDVLGARHPRVLVDGDEPVSVAGQPRDARPLYYGQRDHGAGSSGRSPGVRISPPSLPSWA